MSGSTELTSRSGAAGERTGHPLRLRLFVAGNAPNSAQARANLRALVQRYHVPEGDVEVVDCLLDPLRAFEEGVLVTPTLLKLAPDPTEIIVGTLASVERVAQTLGLDAPRSAEGTHG
ncbi:MAG TPA: circadian clock KaiB family protein [Gemmatimonadaceae bacterium]|jgi:circadian clock protein KaiB|nr:circadian clock KaiB family protein [Gemmatimonadaceae bacterium]